MGPCFTIKSLKPQHVCSFSTHFVYCLKQNKQKDLKKCRYVFSFWNMISINCAQHRSGFDARFDPECQKKINGHVLANVTT